MKNFNIMWTLAKYIYKNIMRSILLKAIDDPDAAWDDAIMLVCDRVFDYNE